MLYMKKQEEKEKKRRNNNMGMLFVLILIMIIIFFIIFAIKGLVFWGIGSFVCWAFSIPFTFTFWHGVAIALIISLITGAFKKEVTVTYEGFRPKIDKWLD